MTSLDEAGCAVSTTKCEAARKDKRDRPKPPEKDDLIDRRLARVKHTVLVMSGKGGVGKSAVAVNVALSLHLLGKKVGLFDVDFHGPSVPTMLGLEHESPPTLHGTLEPVDYLGKLKVMSMGFFLSNAKEAVIWRGPMKMSVIRQLLQETEWGALDYLVFDLPPGTGDEPLSVCQLLGKADGAVIVTTPQHVAIADVRRSIGFCESVQLRVLGVVENMSGFTCPHCGQATAIFESGAGEAMACDAGVPFLGRIPIDLELRRAGDAGVPYMLPCRESAAAEALKSIARSLIESTG
jgi:Mrp family chromosome partitioning ATPase